MNIEWAKLKAVAQELGCSELQAREQLDAGNVQVFTNEELSVLKAFLKRVKVKPLDESILKEVKYGENLFLLWQKQ